MSTTDRSTTADPSTPTETSSAPSRPWAIQLGGSCGCGCCGPPDEQETLSRQEEIAELRRLREETERRLAELEPDAPAGRAASA